MKNRPVVTLMLILTVCYAVGFVGSIATNAGIGFAYIVFNKPAWAIPGWLFVPIWTVMYGLMATAAWHVWKGEASKRGTRALILFAIQLCLGAAWPWMFFGIAKHSFGTAGAILFWANCAAAATIFRWLDAAAGRLMLPVALWATYLVALSGAVQWMNK